MGKYELYFNDSCDRLNSSIYKTTVNGKKYIVKDLDLEDESIFYGAIRELAVLLKLDHPNIIKITDYFIEENVLYIVQPFIENTLYDLIKKHRKEKTDFTSEQIHKILSGSLEALYYLHQNNITHRDLKPENILVRDDCTPIVIDFGQAKKLLFKNSTQISTCYYRSPEVLGFYEKEMTKFYDKKIDVWGIGTIAFEMLTKEQLAKLPEDYEDSEDSENSLESIENESDEGKDSENSLESIENESDEGKDSELDSESEGSVFGSESELESDSEVDSEEHEEDNLFIIHDLFRKLGVPSKRVLEQYNLKKYVPEDENLPDNPVPFLSEHVKEEKALHFLINTLSYDPAKRYSMKQCLECSFINTKLPDVKMIEKHGIIQLNKTGFNMGVFQKEFSYLVKKLKPEGVKEESLFKAKRLALYFLGVYQKKVPRDWLVRLIGVCIYICDNLVSSGNHEVDFYLDLIECGETKFFTILKEVMMRTVDELFII